MFCENCGAKLEDNASFCTNCGAKIEIRPRQVQQPVVQPEVVPVPQQIQPEVVPVQPVQPQYNQIPQPQVQQPQQGQTYQQPVQPQYAQGYQHAQAPVQGKSGGKKGLVIGLVIALVVVIAGAIGAVAFFGNRSDKEDVAEVESRSEAEESTSEVEDEEIVDRDEGSDFPERSEVESDEEPEIIEEDEEPEEPEEAIHSYEVFIEDVSWYEARERAEAMGGYLACISSRDEEKEVISALKEAGLDYAWIGGRVYSVDGEAELEWVSGEDVTYTNWGSGQPSLEDDDGTIEDCLMLWRIGNPKKWSWNDQRSELADNSNETIAKMYQGKIGYVVEYESYQ